MRTRHGARLRPALPACAAHRAARHSDGGHRRDVGGVGREVHTPVLDRLPTLRRANPLPPKVNHGFNRSGQLVRLDNVARFRETIGPAGNFAPLPDAAKWILSGGMLLGRLEIITVFVLCIPAFWRH